MKIKDFMTEDHARLDQALHDLMIAGDDPARQIDLFHLFRAGVERHMAWEEEILFPCIERRSGMHMPGPSSLVKFQHQQIKALLEKLSIQLTRRDQEAEESQKALSLLLARHGEEEEKVLYPWINLCLCEADREEALEKLQRSM
ncbi:MAG TPA: hemerythrin domain-containing protein [Candidatus Manganitrophaceae bacterium]|nr:hemerythrin domain-containing protein [Candidatus Manganitrophaceae bacterium]